MRKDEFSFDVIVTAERGKYLKFKDEALTEDKVGKPIRIILSKQGIIPEFEEVSLDENEVVAEEKPAKKTTRKTTTKKTTKKTDK